MLSLHYLNFLSPLSQFHKGGDRIRGEATSPDIAMQPILKPRKGTRPLQGPAPDPAPRRALPRPPEASSQRRRQRGTHGAVVRLRLRSVNWPIQARPAYVDVTGLGEGFQQLQQRPRIQIVVVIYVAEPSVGMEWGALNSKGFPRASSQPDSPCTLIVNQQTDTGWRGVNI